MSTVQVPLAKHSLSNMFTLIRYPIQMKYTGMIYSYTLIQPEKECIVFDSIKGSFAKPEQKYVQ